LDILRDDKGSKSMVEKNRSIIEIINRVIVDTSYVYDSGRLLDKKIGFMVKNCDKIIDFGKSSRERFDRFENGQVMTVDINEYDGYPDVVDDICRITQLPMGKFDGIICLAVLEHVYNPFLAVDNISGLLKEGGHALLYTPFIWRYHAPKSLIYQDFFRYTRDGLAYLFREFSEVTIYPYRGRYSTVLNMFGTWKAKVENRIGHGLNKIVDRALGRVFGHRRSELQASGYYLWTKK